MQFNHNLETYNTKAAQIVVPIIIEKFNPKSVLDIGCGIGTWLSVFKENGVNEIFGVDGEWVDKNKLGVFIEEKDFLSFDLRNELCLDKKFDLVLSLEVAEHIDEEFADNFVKSLVNHSDLIVFSAAIPFQVGENHVNEQWPSYWIEKFAMHGLYPDDFLRRLIWDNKDVDFWYRQNILVFCKEKQRIDFFNIVHPDQYLVKIMQINSLSSEIEKSNLSINHFLKLKLKNFYLKLKSYFKNGKN